MGGILPKNKVEKAGSILFIGDNETFLSKFRDTLEGRGFNIARSAMGNEAIIEAERTLPNLIILNPDLPDMPGFKCLRILKMRNNTWNIPVILCTRRDLILQEIEESLDIGINDFMSPDIKEGEFLIRFESLMRLRRVEAKIQRLYLERTKELEWSNFELEKIRTELILKNQLATMGRLTAVTTHEIKTPASSILGNIENLPDFINNLMGSIYQLLARTSSPIREEVKYLFHRLESYDPGRPPHVGDELLDRERSIKEIFSKSIRDENVLRFMARWVVKFHLYEDSLSLDAISAILKYGDIGVLKILLSLYEISLKVANMRKSVERIIDVISTMKSYSYMTKAERKVEINRGIEETLSILSYHFKGSVVIKKRFHPHLPAIRAIPGEINQIWTNILTNAYDAMSGRGEIKIRTDLINKGSNPYILVTFSDNGPGIPAEILPHIFTPFFTTKEDGKGIGLGLDITRRIIEKHRGEIEVSSQPGRTTFSILLPATEGEG